MKCIQQVRDLLKGTLAFRGSTMETECDFMEIDNNIAARLQIPSLQQQRESAELPDTLPVPMLANFGHFEDCDEKESSFMTSDTNGKQNEEPANSDELADGLEESELTTHRNTDSNQGQAIALEQREGDSENSRRDDFVKASENTDTEDPFSSFVEGNQDIHSIGSIPLICGDDYSTGNVNEERRSSDNSISTNDSFLSGLSEVKTENGITEPEIKHDQNSIQHNIDTRSIEPPETDPLCNELFEATSNPPKRESGNENARTSPEHEFVFVNRDGTAQASPTPPQQPLEESDEYFY